MDLTLLTAIFLLFWSVVAQPELVVYPSDLKYFSHSELRWPIGNSLQLTCELNGPQSDQYSLVWYLPHAQGRHTNLTNENGRSVLFMSEINSDDTGRYQCKAEKKVGGENAPSIQEKTLILKVISASASESNGCGKGFFQCSSNSFHCIPKRYTCDGYQDCPDSSDETSELCGDEDWCKGKLRCGDEARCLDPALCCDPQIDPSCNILLDCCQPYVNSNRYFFQLGIEQSKNQRRNQTENSGHLAIMIGKSCL